MTNVTKDSSFVTDPVSHRAFERDKAEGKSFYGGTMYYFETRVDKMTFDEDPELWIPTPHASMTSASIPSDQLL